MNFDMNTCWARGIELLQSNFSLLIVIAGMFVLLPTMAIYMLVPEFQMLSDPALDQAALEDRMGDLIAPIAVASAISMLFQFIGQGAMIALMGEKRPTVGEALATGAKAVPSLFAVLIFFMLFAILGGFIITLPISLIGAVMGAPGIAALAIVPMLIFIIWTMARLSMTMPNIVLTGRLNPVAAMVESFRMTAPKQWSIAGFWAMIYIVMTIVSVLFNGIAGVVAAIAGTGTAAMAIVGLANGVTGAASSLITCALAAAMFAQLTGANVKTLGETFE